MKCPQCGFHKPKKSSERARLAERMKRKVSDLRHLAKEKNPNMKQVEVTLARLKVYVEKIKTFPIPEAGSPQQSMRNAETLIATVEAMLK